MAVTISIQPGGFFKVDRLVIKSKHTTTGAEEVREIPLGRIFGKELQVKGDIKEVMRLLGQPM